MKKYYAIGMVLGLALQAVATPAMASDIASRVMTGLNGGTPPAAGSRPHSGLLNFERGGEEHKIDHTPKGVPPLLVSDYEPGDTFSIYNQRAKLIKPDGAWILLTYHGRWQASKQYSSGRRVDLNRVSGEVLYDSKNSKFARR